MFEIRNKRKGTEEHVFAAAISERLDDVENFFLTRHASVVPVQVIPASGCSNDRMSFSRAAENHSSIVSTK